MVLLIKAHSYFQSGFKICLLYSLGLQLDLGILLLQGGKKPQQKLIILYFADRGILYLDSFFQGSSIERSSLNVKCSCLQNITELSKH